MQIVDDWLVPEQGVTIAESPNHTDGVEQRYLVMHYTAGRDAGSAVAHLQQRVSQASAHLVIGRDGHIYQLVSFASKAWHAGKSSWAGLVGLNNYSIGIELDNAGKLTRVGDRYQAWFGDFYPESEVVRARHKHEEQEAYWHTFTSDQMRVAVNVACLLVEKYRLKDVIGHDDIAPGRKSDPGPAFDMGCFRAAVMGRKTEAEEVVVDAGLLNIRSGPGVAFPVVAAPLGKNTILDVVEKRSLWTQVRMTDGAEIVGWVRNAYVKAAT